MPKRGHQDKHTGSAEWADIFTLGCQKRFITAWCRLNTTTKLVLDLDPGEGIEWEFVKDTALPLRDFLKEQEALAIWPKATGGKDFHVMVP